MCVLGMGCVHVQEWGRRVTLHLSNHFKGSYVPGPMVNVGDINLKIYKDKRNPCLKEFRV